MKKHIFLILVVLAVFAGCKDEDQIRFPEINEAINMRVHFEDGLNFFDFSDINNAFIRYSLFTENPGIVDSVIISIVYEPTGGGDELGPEVARVYRGSDFQNGAVENEELTVSEIVDLFDDLTLDDLNGGDNFQLQNRVVLTNGVSYPGLTPLGTLNIEPAITGSSATNSFTTTLNVLVGCPLGAPFTGAYLLEQVTVNENWNGGGNMFPDQTVTLSTGANPITRNFGVTYLGFADRAFTIILLCDNVILPGFISAGLACAGGPTLGNGPDPDNIETYNSDDDSEILVSFIENPDMGCGVAPTPTTFRLTKQ